VGGRECSNEVSHRYHRAVSVKRESVVCPWQQPLIETDG
jgi:hypothetical protein